MRFSRRVLQNCLVLLQSEAASKHYARRTTLFIEAWCSHIMFVECRPLYKDM